MAGRLDNLRAINADRWKSHAQSQAGVASSIGVGHDDDHDHARDRDREQLLAPTAVALDSGASLGPADPMRIGRAVEPYIRTPDARAPSSAPPPPRSAHAYRIPPTSVTRKRGKCKLFGCCGWRLSAAQWIWWLNFVCFCAHTAMIFVTLWFAYWRHGRNAFRDTEHLMIPIYRIRNVPTQLMLDNNESQWSPGWNLTSSEPNSGLFLYDNGFPVNFATLIIAFFATSAIFHFGALVAGAFEYFWFWYWRQLDDAFAWWRWAEYSISASLMAMSMAITLGIREQYALAGIFMLTFATQTYGFLTEWSSTPKAYVDEQNYKYPVGPYQLKKYAEGAADYGVTNYHEDPNALKLIDQTEWFMDRPMYEFKAAPEVVTRGAVGTWWKTSYSNARAQRTASWLRRMVPSIFGWFTMTSVWFILFTQLENARRDIGEISDQNMPEWVYAVIVGSVIIFMSFALVLIVFQRLRPGFYWGTEIAYCILSLTAKMYLGWFLLINVLYVDGSTADETLRAQNEVRR